MDVNDIFDVFETEDETGKVPANHTNDRERVFVGIQSKKKNKLKADSKRLKKQKAGIGTTEVIEAVKDFLYNSKDDSATKSESLSFDGLMEEQRKMKREKFEADSDKTAVIKKRKSKHKHDGSEKQMQVLTTDVKETFNELSVVENKVKYEQKAENSIGNLVADDSIKDDLPGQIDLENAQIDDVLKYLEVHMDKSRVRVETFSTNGCIHNVALPPDIEYIPFKMDDVKLITSYPFELDPFQKEAISCISNNESVLVSAHTSSGKTVVAEYSIALALANNQRVIYTTPIKALSNQKYREFDEKFHDVGLVTGDVTLNFEASCLIMTTEILRNMLYRGSEIMREVAWVIFDEIHYMRDQERGVVWEETLILLPDNIHSVFLSATIPNASQFAEWVSYLHHQPCHIIYTDTRPVPLEHYIYPAGDTAMHLVVDQFGNFREESFNKAMESITKTGGGGNPLNSDLGAKCCDIIQLLISNQYTPMIVFSFSKKECEFYASLMTRRCRVESEVQDAITKIFSYAISGLSELDQKLPQVTTMLTILQKGIGIHHGGLLPILKEVVEILFAEGLLKTLFATETFAMGLNMPARTVMFTSCRKFDGREMRLITSGEYIQMSGRAGRRGLDDKGTTIIMATEALTPEDVKKVTKGQADHLNSAFHLTYNTILNLIRVEGINPEYILEKSFHQFQNQGNIPQLFDKMKQLEQERMSIKIPNELQVAEYYNLKETLSSLADKFRSFIFHPNAVIGFLNPGRLVKIKQNDNGSDWSMVLSHRRKSDKIEGPYIEIDLLICKEPPIDGTYPPKLEIISVKNTELFEISSVKLKHPDDLRSTDKQIGVYDMIQEVKRRFDNNLPLLNPKRDMNIKGEMFDTVIDAIESNEQKFYNHPLFKSNKVESLYLEYSRKIATDNEIARLKQELKHQVSSSFLHELRCRKRVLRRMNYCTSTDVILQKGRVACELSSGEELLLTELIFNGIFNDLTVPQSVALLSCILCDEKSKQMLSKTQQLSGPLRKMQELARTIAQISIESSIEMDEDDYVGSLKPHLMDACFAWSSGATFTEVCGLTDLFEGSIIRCLRRMEEMLRQLIQAAKSIGNAELEEKFSQAVVSIKRDIAFAPSLYL